MPFAVIRSLDFHDGIRGVTKRLSGEFDRFSAYVDVWPALRLVLESST